MVTQRIFLVINADKSVRVAKRPQIRIDEIAFTITLRFPDNWGRVQLDADFVIDVPDFTPAVEISDVMHEQTVQPTP